MRIPTYLLTALLVAVALNGLYGQTGEPSTERIWKDISRLPHALRDDISSASWWTNSSEAIRLDSTVKYSNFSNARLLPLNKTVYAYPGAGKTVQSDFVNYGLWVLEKRTTITRDPQGRIVDVLEELADMNTDAAQPSTKITFFWHGNSATQSDSIISSAWDEQWQQWVPAARLYSFFNGQNQETATETYRYEEGFQVIGIREEYEFDVHDNVSGIRQFLLKDGKWTLLGKVQSMFDEKRHEISRLEEIAVGDNRFAAVRKLSRKYDAEGQLSVEERFKWNNSKSAWTPLKTIKAGIDNKHDTEWTIVESYTKSASVYKTKEEKIKRRKDKYLEREVNYTFQPASEKWQEVSEIRYYYKS